MTVNADKSVSLHIEVATNEAEVKRTANVTITTKSAEKGDRVTFREISVEQDLRLPVPFIVVDDADKTVTFTGKAGDKTIIVSANREVEATSSEPWCTPTMTVNADQSVSLRIEVTKNEDNTQRTAEVTIVTQPAKTGDETTSLVISVEQDVAPQDLEKDKWTIAACNNSWSALPVDRILDGNAATIWHTDPALNFTTDPIVAVIDFSKPLKISGILFSNATDAAPDLRDNTPKHVKFEASDDQVTWTEILDLEVPRIYTEQTLPCDRVSTGQYLRLTIYTGWNAAGTWTYLGDLSIY
ncbi:MAG: discoidin domain-containing protein, partial [Bacteroidales bacterium]|jgi:hypothetical protein|nr:discoidin domain-containing protein [Bacteroidales bacterium]